MAINIVCNTQNGMRICEWQPKTQYRKLKESVKHLETFQIKEYVPFNLFKALSVTIFCIM